MRKSLLLTIVAMMASCAAIAQDEQFVSTTPSNKNVVIEEYTGINCGACPDGHRIANQIAAAHPGRVIVVNIHAGGYAANTYTTSSGNTLRSTFNINSFPTGTVNRHSFSSGLVLERNYWSSCTNTILNQASPVNIAARGTLDWATRELNITVQLYYTSDEANATNKLNVAIIQDNVIGSQSGASYNPAQQVGSQYRHMHMFRGFITEGAWGEAVSPTTAGSFIEKTYTYTIPASLGSPNAITAKLEDLHFVAFVAQGNQEILTGCEVEIEHVLPALNPRLDQLSQIPLNDCSAEAKVGATVSNVGSSPLTSLTFEYTVANGAPQTYNWTGNIASMTAETIELPTLNVAVNTNQAVKVKFVNANGTAFESEQMSLTIKKSVVQSDGAMTLKIKADDCSTTNQYNNGEQSFKLYSPTGAVVQTVGASSFTNNAVNEFPLTITTEGCYRLEVMDAYGDGIRGGYVRLYNAAGSQVYSASGTSFSDKLIVMIASGEGVSVDDMTIDEDMTVYPNPTSDVVNILTGLAIQQVEVYNLQGQRVAAEAGNVSNISLNGLANGMYILKVTTEKGVNTYKISKR